MNRLSVICRSMNWCLANRLSRKILKFDDSQFQNFSHFKQDTSIRQLCWLKGIYTLPNYLVSIVFKVSHVLPYSFLVLSSPLSFFSLSSFSFCYFTFFLSFPSFCVSFLPFICFFQSLSLITSLLCICTSVAAVRFLVLTSTTFIPFKYIRKTNDAVLYILLALKRCCTFSLNQSLQYHSKT